MSVEEFHTYRDRMNQRILAEDNLVLKRFFALDKQAYEGGALSSKIKEMLGLVASLVLRCDDCVKYHLEKCFHEKLTDKELFEILSIANLVGGSIVIPHTRRAVEYWDELKRHYST